MDSMREANIRIAAASAAMTEQLEFTLRVLQAARALLQTSQRHEFAVVATTAATMFRGDHLHMTPVPGLTPEEEALANRVYREQIAAFAQRCTEMVQSQ